MCETIIISSSDEAEAMLRILENCKQAARTDDFASERAKKIKWLCCTCCGNYYRGRQWWNQDCGYGLGDCCVKYCGVDPNGGESETYGVPGIHFLLPKTDA